MQISLSVLGPRESPTSRHDASISSEFCLCHLSWNMEREGGRVRAQLNVPLKAKRPPRSASPTSSEGSQQQPLGNEPSLPSLGRRPSILTFHALHSFVQRNNWVFEVLFPKCYSCPVSHQDVVCTRGIVVFLSCLHFPEGFCFLGLQWLLHSHSPAQFFVSVIQLSPVFSFDAFVQSLKEGVPVIIYQGRPLSFFFNVVDIDI